MVATQAALTGLKADGIEAADPANTTVLVAVAAGGLALGGAFLLLAMRAGMGSCPPGTQPVSGVSGACCPNGTTYDPISKTCKNPSGGGCPNCVAPNTCVNNTCGPPSILTCPGGCADPKTTCVLGQCLPITGPAPLPGCLQACDVDQFCNPSSGQCELICDPTCIGATFSYCDASPCVTSGFFDGCGNCVSVQPDWQVSNVTAELDVSTLVAGDTPTVVVQFDYVGPGGPVSIGWSVSSDSPLPGFCEYTFSDQTQYTLVPTSVPQHVSLPYVSPPWPYGCWLCFGLPGPLATLLQWNAVVYYPFGNVSSPVYINNLTC